MPMHFPVMRFVGIVVLSAIGAVLGLFRSAISSGEDPSDDGPRAVVAQFFGIWIGSACFIWSFFVADRHVVWALRGAGVVAAAAGIGLSLYFALTPEVPDPPDEFDTSHDGGEMLSGDIERGKK
jgi:hypothetical protein